MRPRRGSEHAQAVEKLRADIELLTPQNTTVRRAKMIYRRAKQLGRCDLVPDHVLSLLESQKALTCTDTARAERALNTSRSDDKFDYQACLAAKSVEADIPLVYLRASFMRGIVEYVHLNRDHRFVPVRPQEWANARVNSMIRLDQGDPDARTDDWDLVQRLRRFRAS